MGHLCPCNKHTEHFLNKYFFPESCSHRSKRTRETRTQRTGIVRSHDHKARRNGSSGEAGQMFTKAQKPGDKMPQ